MERRIYILISVYPYDLSQLGAVVVIFDVVGR